MNHHIDRTDIIRLVFPDKTSPININRIALINQHLMHCNECKKVYEDALVLEQQIQQNGSDDIIAKMMMLLYSKKKDLKTIERIISGVKQELSLSIISNEKVEIIKNTLYSDFIHPQYQKAVVKALNDYPNKDSKEINESILGTNDESLFLCIDEDMTFSVYYPKEKSIINEYVFLVDENDQKIYISQLKDYNYKNNIATFFDVKAGNYQLLRATV